MPPEVKDQAQPAPSAAPAPAPTPAPGSAASSSPTPTAKPDLPKKGENWFGSGKLRKYAEQSHFFDPEPAAPAAPAAAPKPVSTPAPAASELFEINGEKLTKDQVTERLKSARSGASPDALQALNRLVTLLENKQKPVVETDVDEDELDLMDPAVAKRIRDQKAENIRLQKQIDAITPAVAQNQREKLERDTDAAFEEARLAHPFDTVVHPKTGEDLSEKVFAGICGYLINQDKMAGRKVKDIPEYVREATVIVSDFQSTMRGASAEPVTTDLVSQKYPKVAKEIGDAAVADYLNAQRGLPPSPRPTQSEPSSRSEGSPDKKGIKSVKQGINAFFDDPRRAADFAASLEAQRKK
jgi:hypothetical protein